MTNRETWNVYTPYRVFASGTSYRVVGRGNRRHQEPRGYAYVVWNPDSTVEPSRLPGSGTFLWPGLHAARRAALAQFDDQAVHQVSVRTNQDRTVYIWNRNRHGVVTGHLALK